MSYPAQGTETEGAEQRGLSTFEFWNCVKGQSTHYGAIFQTDRQRLGKEG